MLKKGDIRLTYYRDKIEKLENEDYSLRGKTGYCFIEDNEIIKVYSEPIREYKIDDLSSSKSTRIAFPKFYIKKHDEYYAEIMEYFPYLIFFYSLTENDNYLINLYNNYKLMIEEIKKFPNIMMNDLGFHGNVLYDNEKGFYLIDTTDWKIDNFGNREKINIEMFNRSLFLAMKLYLFGDIDDRIFQKEIENMYRGIRNINVGKELLEIMKSSLNGNYDFISFLKAYSDVVKIYFNVHLKTTEDMQKYVKMLKNS